MSFGDQTVKFVAVTDGASDRNNQPAQVRTLVTVSGSHFRPLRFSEKMGLFDIATEVWQWTGPPDEAVLSAKSVDELLYDGTTDPADIAANRFLIVGGIQPHNDFSNTVHKVTVLCQKQSA